MRESLRRLLVGQVASLLCYLTGMLLFLVVASRLFLSSSGASLSAPTTVDVLTLLASVVLIALGGAIGWRSGGLGGMEPGTVGTISEGDADQSTLANLGYQVPNPEPDETAAVDRDAVDGPTVRCPACGTPNDRSYTYCRNCSGELPR